MAVMTTYIPDEVSFLVSVPPDSLDIATVLVESSGFDFGSVPIVGLPGPVPIFYWLHLTAITALVPSILCSGGVLTYILQAAGRQFWQHPIGERLVVYLSVCDVMLSITHLSDHVYLFSWHAFPPEVLCQVFGFSLQEFSLAQAIVITYTACSAFSMVVWEHRLSLGRGDWRLVLTALGIPAVPLSVAGAYGYLGPTGTWCSINLFLPYGPAIQNGRTIIILVTFFVNVVCYILVWLKIKQVSSAMASMDAGEAASRGRYQRSARIMMLFVGVYIAQWWAPVIYSLWTFYGRPHLVVVVATVIFTNLGGMFNFLAYSFVRRIGREKKTKVNPPQPLEMSRKSKHK